MKEAISNFIERREVGGITILNFANALEIIKRLSPLVFQFWFRPNHQRGFSTFETKPDPNQNNRASSSTSNCDQCNQFPYAEPDRWSEHAGESQKREQPPKQKGGAEKKTDFFFFLIWKKWNLWPKERWDRALSLSFCQVAGFGGTEEEPISSSIAIESVLNLPNHFCFTFLWVKKKE